MLRVTVELVPHGDESGKKKLVEMLIANTGDGYQGTNCDYEGWISSCNWTKDTQRYGKVKDHDRRQSVWVLISKMVDACMPKFSPDKSSHSLAQRLKERLAEFQLPEEVVKVLQTPAEDLKTKFRAKRRKKR